jgi:hypothetical protein
VLPNRTTEVTRAIRCSTVFSVNVELNVQSNPKNNDVTSWLQCCHVTRVQVTREIEFPTRLSVAARLTYPTVDQDFSLSSLLNQRRRADYIFLTSNIHTIIFASSCMHGLTRVATSASGNIVFRDGPCFWPHPQQTSQSQREGQQPVSYSRTKIRYNERECRGLSALLKLICLVCSFLAVRRQGVSCRFVVESSRPRCYTLPSLSISSSLIVSIHKKRRHRQWTTTCPHRNRHSFMTRRIILTRQGMTIWRISRQPDISATSKVVKWRQAQVHLDRTCPRLINMALGW